jgi:hypothetical protein
MKIATGGLAPFCTAAAHASLICDSRKALLFEQNAKDGYMYTPLEDGVNGGKYS